MKNIKASVKVNFLWIKRVNATWTEADLRDMLKNAFTPDQLNVLVGLITMFQNDWTVVPQIVSALVADKLTPAQLDKLMALLGEFQRENGTG